jgi:hypothetical protein
MRSIVNALFVISLCDVLALHAREPPIAAAKGQTKAAIDQWTKAVAIQDRVDYGEHESDHLDDVRHGCKLTV